MRWLGERCNTSIHRSELEEALELKPKSDQSNDFQICLNSRVRCRCRCSVASLEAGPNGGEGGENPGQIKSML